MNAKRANEDDRKIYRNQLVTIADLEAFKNDLIQEIRTAISNHTPSSKKWLKSAEVKKLLGISNGTLHTLRINGSLSYSKVGGIMFYDYSEIVKLLESNEQR